MKEGYPPLKELAKDFQLVDLATSSVALSQEELSHCQAICKNYQQPKQNVLVFVNGILNEDLSDIEKKEIELKILPTPAPKFTNKQEKSRAENISYLLNNYCFQEYLQLIIQDNTTLVQPLLLLHLYNGKTTHAPAKIPLYQTKLSIEIGENSHLALQEIYSTTTPKATRDTYGCNIHNTIELKPAATLKHYLLQNHSLHHYHFVSTNLKLEKSAEYQSFLAQFGSKLSIHRQSVLLNDIHSKVDLTGIYLVNKEQHLQNLIHIEHRVRDCKSNQLFKGILKDQAKANFTGKVSVQPKSTNTLSNQINRNILLGDKANVESNPQLEINNDDVKCSHGSTTGRLNPLEIFYLCSRGIPKTKAINLLSFAFINECLLKIADEDLKEKITADVNQFFIETNE